jgi:hypothetical protein
VRTSGRRGARVKTSMILACQMSRSKNSNRVHVDAACPMGRTNLMVVVRVAHIQKPRAVIVP